MAMLKLIVDLELLIGAEGADPSGIQRRLPTPQAPSAEEAPGPLRGKRAPGAEVNNKVQS